MNDRHDILAEIENLALGNASDGAGQKDEGLLFAEELDLDSLFDFSSPDDIERSSAPSKEPEKRDTISRKSGIDEKVTSSEVKGGKMDKGVVMGPTLHLSDEDSANIRSKLPAFSALKSEGKEAKKRLNGVGAVKLGAEIHSDVAKPAEAKTETKLPEAKTETKTGIKQSDGADPATEKTTESVTLSMEDIKVSVGDAAEKAEKAEEPAKKAEELAKKAEEPAKKAEELAQKAEEPAQKAEEPAKKAEEPAKKAEELAKKAEELAEKAEELAEKAEEPAKKVEKATPHVLSKDSDSIEISAVGDVFDPEKKNSDSIEISAISSIVDTKKPEKISSSIEISGVSSTVNAEDKKPWEQTESSVSEICSVPDVEANFEKTQINLDAVGGEKNVTVIKKGHSPQPQPMEPIVFDVEEVAPDMSNEPVQPKSVFEKTMSFEMSDNRWEHADKFVLPEIGDVVGNYQVTGLLGKGGFGAVYRAKNLTLGREEALKLILPSAKSECEDIEKRFEREIDIVSRLEHPNIVRLYSSGLLEHHVLWMTMELVKGARLDDRLSQYGPMKFPKAKNLMLQLLSGLMEAHRRQIVHRDLKPANIMLSKKEGYADQVVILDFGLSKALGDTEDESKQNLTCVDSRRVYGTPQYMAPEQLKQGKLGPWTDVYASGLIFYELLTGQEAVQGMSLFDVAYKQTYEDLEFPPDLQDTAVEAMLKRACAKNPAERYKNAGEFFDALQHIEEISDPPSVLSDSRKNDTDLANMGMLSKTRDEKSEEKTQLGLQAISMDPTEVIRHAEHTGRSRRRADGIKIALFVVSALLVGLILIGVCAYFFGYLSITV